MNASNNREQLKKKYKKHYRELLETKKRLRELERAKKATSGFSETKGTSTDLINQMEELVTKIKQRASLIESKVEIALDTLKSDGSEQEASLEQQERKRRARDTINLIKNEMGQLYSEMETQARELDAEKTVGIKPTTESDPKNSSSNNTD